MADLLDDFNIEDELKGPDRLAEAEAEAIQKPKKIATKKERQSKKVLLSLTETEYAKLAEEAGLAPMAKFIRIKMQEAGII